MLNFGNVGLANGNFRPILSLRHLNPQQVYLGSAVQIRRGRAAVRDVRLEFVQVEQRFAHFQPLTALKSGWEG